MSKIKNMNKIIGKNIRNHRRLMEISQADFARSIGMKNRQSISMIEQGKQSMTPYHLHQAAKRLGITVERLISES